MTCSPTMPELPEVEVAAQNLRRWALGRTIVAADGEPTRVLRPGSPAGLAVLAGLRVGAIDRIGKHLLITLGRGRERTGVVSHLGMTGKWLRRREHDAPPRYSRLRLHLDDVHVLHYCDMRLFGRFRIVAGARFDEVPEVRKLGPDPLTAGIDADRLHAALHRAKRPVKVTLMDQALLPGIGNIQASEALFRARIDPRRSGASISRDDAERIARGVLDSIRDTISDFQAAGYDRRDGAEVAYVEEGAENPFAVYGREGEPCPRCAAAELSHGAGTKKSRRRAPSPIERVVQGGRSTFFCPRCQT